jgi:hypothetical protein
LKSKKSARFGDLQMLGDEIDKDGNYNYGNDENDKKDKEESKKDKESKKEETNNTCNYLFSFLGLGIGLDFLSSKSKKRSSKDTLWNNDKDGNDKYRDGDDNDRDKDGKDKDKDKDGKDKDGKDKDGIDIGLPPPGPPPQPPSCPPPPPSDPPPPPSCPPPPVTTTNSTSDDLPKLSQRDAFLLEISKARSQKTQKKSPINQQPKPKKLEEQITKPDLIMELLGYMESPGGNVSQFAEALTSYTDTSRNFIDTFVRRGWLLGVRVDVVKNNITEPESCVVW